MTSVRGLDAVKAATWPLHKRAERGGIIADILAGRANRTGVALLLRNLLPVYQALDGSPFGVPALARSAAIKADLRVVSPGAKPVLLRQGRVYGDRIRRLAEGGEASLVAHAYVLYLGDLNGGQIMKRRLVACLGDLVIGLTVHDYPMLTDVSAFIRDYREYLDQAVDAAGIDKVIQEAVTAFEMHIALSEAIGERVAEIGSPT